jgi:hypothetical protein
LKSQELDVHPLLQALVTHFAANSIPHTCSTSSAAWEQTILSAAHVNASWNRSKHAWVNAFFLTREAVAILGIKLSLLVHLFIYNAVSRLYSITLFDDSEK